MQAHGAGHPYPEKAPVQRPRCIIDNYRYRGHETVGDLRPQVVHDQQVAAVEVLAEILEAVLEPSVKGIPGQRVEQAGGAEIEDGTAPLEKLPGDAAGEEALAGAYGAVEEKVPADLPELPYEFPADEPGPGACWRGMRTRCPVSTRNWRSLPVGGNVFWRSTASPLSC